MDALRKLEGLGHAGRGAPAHKLRKQRRAAGPPGLTPAPAPLQPPCTPARTPPPPASAPAQHGRTHRSDCRTVNGGTVPRSVCRPGARAGPLGTSEAERRHPETLTTAVGSTPRPASHRAGPQSPDASHGSRRSGAGRPGSRIRACGCRPAASRARRSCATSRMSAGCTA